MIFIVIASLSTAISRAMKYDSRITCLPFNAPDLRLRLPRLAHSSYDIEEYMPKPQEYLQGLCALNGNGYQNFGCSCEGGRKVICGKGATYNDAITFHGIDVEDTCKSHCVCTNALAEFLVGMRKSQFPIYDWLSKEGERKSSRGGAMGARGRRRGAMERARRPRTSEVDRLLG